ncbi:MAG: hypothetical protein PWR01_1710 [Clostridiales bacterium]|nr:hypothetical protein [Clostridiales bacterium]
MNKRLKVSLLVIAVMLVAGTFYGIYVARNNYIEKLLAQYPTYGDPPYMERGMIPDVQVLVEYSDVVIVGQVNKSVDKYTVTFDGNKATPEGVLEEKSRSMGNEPNRTEFITTQIKVLDVLAGSLEGEEILITRSCEFDGYQPELIPGEKMVFFLRKGSGVHEGKYLPVDNLCGYIYITSDDKIVPVVKEDKYRKYVGMSLNSFKKQIGSFKK